MNHTIHSSLITIAVRALGATLAIATASAQAATLTAASASTYQEECGSCHTAYPARFLKPADWTAVLGNLDRHYGTDATLDSAAVGAVARHLGVGAPPAQVSSTTALPRITRSGWFVREHDEISAATFKSPAVRSAANCSACHSGADRGDFDEHSIRMPQGTRHE
jgi:mono/diheme cytochrome c family protein